jgi:hypothetical protein
VKRLGILLLPIALALMWALRCRTYCRTTSHTGIPGASAAALTVSPVDSFVWCRLDELYNFAYLWTLDFEDTHTQSRPKRWNFYRTYNDHFSRRWLKATYRHSGSMLSMNSTSCELRASPSRMCCCAGQRRSRYAATFSKSNKNATAMLNVSACVDLLIGALG